MWKTFTCHSDKYKVSPEEYLNHSWRSYWSKPVFSGAENFECLLE